jgi:GT2 family glycosyltransferase
MSPRDSLYGPAADLTVVIVTYRVRDLTRACLESVRVAAAGHKVDVHLVENGSGDGTLEMVAAEFPEVRLVDAGENLGFIRGNNVILDELLREGTAGRYVLLLNPDTVVQPDTFHEMLTFMHQHPEAGAATCRVDLASGGLDWACHRGFPTPWAALTYMLGGERLFPRSRRLARYHRKWLDLGTTHEIDSPTGAFFLVRREVFERVGALDTDFFMYGDDLDWAWRIKAGGWRIYYHPGTRILHYKGVSTGLKTFSTQWSRADTQQRVRRSNDFYDAMGIFYEKHLARRDPAPLRLAVRAGIRSAKLVFAMRFRLAGTVATARRRLQ